MYRGGLPRTSVPSIDRRSWAEPVSSFMGGARMRWKAEGRFEMQEIGKGIGQLPWFLCALTICCCGAKPSCANGEERRLYPVTVTVATDAKSHALTFLHTLAEGMKDMNVQG